MSKEIMQQALDALKEIIGSKMSFRQSDAIAALEAELAKPVNEFNPDWDQIKPYHDRIAELEAQLAQPEQEPVAWLYNGHLHECDPSDWAEEEVTPLYKTPPINKMPTKIFGPNLEQILNAAGFYKRDVDTNQQNVNTSEERVQISDKSIHERKYPNHETYCGRCGACTYKPWVGLTDDEIDTAWRIVDYTESYEEFRISVARAIETKLREKNET